MVICTFTRETQFSSCFGSSPIIYFIFWSFHGFFLGKFFAQVFLIFPNEDILDWMYRSALEQCLLRKGGNSNFRIFTADETKLSRRVPTNKPLRDGALKITLCIIWNNIKMLAKSSSLFHLFLFYGSLILLTQLQFSGYLSILLKLEFYKVKKCE